MGSPPREALDFDLIMLKTVKDFKAKWCYVIHSYNVPSMVRYVNGMNFDEAHAYNERSVYVRMRMLLIFARRKGDLVAIVQGMLKKQGYGTKAIARNTRQHIEGCSHQITVRKRT